MTSTFPAIGLDREIGPRLAHLAREDAVLAEARGRVGASFIEMLREIGSCTGPSSHGGSNPPLRDVLDLIKVVAAGDGSAGWVAMIYLTSAVSGHWLAPEGRDAVFARRAKTLVAGVLAPRGIATTKDDGFELSGQWPFGSGGADADWMGLGALIDGHPERSAVLFVPRHEIETLSTWEVMGLRATASNDQVVTRAFVPAHRVAYFDQPNRTGEPVANFPILGLLAAGIGAVAIGIAEATLEAFVELSGLKTPTGSKRRLVDRATVQEAVARAQAGIESCWHYLAERSVEPSDPPSAADRVRLRLAATSAVETSRAIVDRLYTLAGGSSLYQKSPLQRHLRDIHTATQHMMVGQPTWEMTGRVLLGLDDEPGGL